MLLWDKIGFVKNGRKPGSQRTDDCSLLLLLGSINISCFLIFDQFTVTWIDKTTSYGVCLQHIISHCNLKQDGNYIVAWK